MGQWFSFGPEVVWDRSARAPLTWGELEEKAARFFECTHNQAAIEFWYTEPVDHWYKIYVSDQAGDGYRINQAAYLYALGQLAQRK